MLVVQYISSGHLSWIKWNMLDASLQNGGSHSLSRALSISVVACPTKIHGNLPAYGISALLQYVYFLDSSNSRYPSKCQTFCSDLQGLLISICETRA